MRCTVVEPMFDEAFHLSVALAVVVQQDKNGAWYAEARKGVAKLRGILDYIGPSTTFCTRGEHAIAELVVVLCQYLKNLRVISRFCDNDDLPRPSEYFEQLAPLDSEPLPERVHVNFFER